MPLHLIEDDINNGVVAAGNAVATTGTNTYAASLAVSLTAYVANAIYIIEFVNANTSTVTLNIDGLGAKAVKRNGGVSLLEGDILAGQIFSIMYDGTDFQITGRVSTKALGDIYISTSIETVISTVSTPVKALGTTTSSNLSNFDMPASNRLRYIGESNETFVTHASISMTTAANNKILNFYYAVNGVVKASSKQSRKVGTGADVGTLSLICALELATNDYVEVWVENITDNTNMTVENMNFTTD